MTSTLRLVFVSLVLIAMAGSLGCYQPTVAPELTFAPEKVQELEKQIQEFDWE